MTQKNPALALNEQYDTLSNSLNNYPALDKNTTAIINKAISDWQDWFYADNNYDKWPDTSNWLKAYNMANALLVKTVKKKKVKKGKPVVTASKKPVVVAPSLLVTAKPPIDYRWWLVGGAVVFFGWIYFMDKKDRSQY